MKWKEVMTLAIPTKKKMIEFLGEKYQPSDDQLIDLYVENYAIYKRMKADLKKQPLLVEHTNKAGATNATKNPLLIEIPKYVTMLNHLLKSLGLTPAQRRMLEEETKTPVKGSAFDDF